jgi:hypothetical protein
MHPCLVQEDAAHAEEAAETQLRGSTLQDLLAARSAADGGPIFDDSLLAGFGQAVSPVLTLRPVVLCLDDGRGVLPEDAAQWSRACTDAERTKLTRSPPGAQVGEIAAEELSRQRPGNVGSAALMPDLQLHVGRGHGAHAVVGGGGSTAQEV